MNRRSFIGSLAMVLAGKLPIVKAAAAVAAPEFDLYVVAPFARLQQELAYRAGLSVQGVLSAYYNKKFLDNLKGNLVLDSLLVRDRPPVASGAVRLFAADVTQAPPPLPPGTYREGACCNWWPPGDDDDEEWREEDDL